MQDGQGQWLLILTIKFSKRDRRGESMEVTIGAGAGGLCAVQEAWEYTQRWRAHAHPDEPWLVSETGGALTFSTFGSMLKEAIVAIGEDPGLFAMRIGGATTLGSMEVPEYVLQQAGRWSSIVYRRYTRRDVSRMAALGRGMALARPLVASRLLARGANSRFAAGFAASG